MGKRIRISKKGIAAAALVGVAGAGAYYAFLAHRHPRPLVISRGRSSSRAVTLLFDSVPNRHTPALCRWLHENHLSATFFLKEGFTGTKGELAQLRPFEIGATVPTDRRRREWNSLRSNEVIKSVQGRGPTYSLLKQGAVPREATTNGANHTICIRPSVVLPVELDPEIWKRSLEQEISKLRGGEFVLVELPADVPGGFEIAPYLDQFKAEIEAAGLRIWGLNALLRGHNAG